MSRKRLTQRFPFLLPLRKKQRNFCFYMGMHFDHNCYAKEKNNEKLPFQLFETKSLMLNTSSGFDMEYQINKVFNLRLAAQTINKIIIRPEETFSFWKLAKVADRHEKYKYGLNLLDGEIIPNYGGGLCQLSNLLFWLFIHTPLVIIERHPHDVKSFSSPLSDIPEGTDATVSEGWLDLKVKNETNSIFQIDISFDEEYIYGSILTDQEPQFKYEIFDENLVYLKEDNKVYQKVSIYQRLINYKTKEITNKLLYNNKCEIGYELLDDVKFINEENKAMEKKKIAILFGGCSTEYGVSLQSAYAVISHMNLDLSETILIGITRQGEWFRYYGSIENIANDTWNTKEYCVPAMISPSRDVHGIIEHDEGKIKITRIDMAFPMMHGNNGEDGTVQGLIELAGIPLIGCGTLCSALCMNKDIAHKVVEVAGIRTPSAIVIKKGTDEKIIFEHTKNLNYPLFVKPVRSGSSLGISKIDGEEHLLTAVKAAFVHDNQVIIEENIEGFEVGCAVIGNDNLIIGEVDEIELTEGFFDYTKKYTLKTSNIHMPARIDSETSDRIKKTATIIYKALGCKGFARVDMFLTPTGEIIFNEVNTIPGFTAHSRYPNMLKGIGLSFEEILDNLLSLAV